MFKQTLAAAGAAVVMALASATAASAEGHVRHEGHGGPGAPFTFAVYGDAPYGTRPSDTAELDATPGFIDSVNADRQVSTVVHVGDIHSGKQYCTQTYDQAVHDLWNRFDDPLVYTPGDNEWADCHKPGEGGGTFNPVTGQIDYILDPATQQPVDYAKGNPLANLDLVRSIFFAEPGHTLGRGKLKVASQARAHDRAHPGDAKYVENVLWEQHRVVFVTINVPGGSNNDADPWYKTPSASPQQQREMANRTAADVRWLDTAFDLADAVDAEGVVVVTQADMWDLDGKTAAHLSNYEPIISSVAAHTTAFGGPVLMFNGDSHAYRSDDPLAPAAPCTGDAGVCGYDAWNSHPSYDVANFHRVVVHGSTFPLEWLKLSVDPAADNAAGPTAFGPFSWTRMPQT